MMDKQEKVLLKNATHYLDARNYCGLLSTHSKFSAFFQCDQMGGTRLPAITIWCKDTIGTYLQTNMDKIFTHGIRLPSALF